MINSPNLGELRLFARLFWRLAKPFRILPGVTLRAIEYIDHDGRLWARGLPDDVPDSQAKVGVPLGPPPLTSLGLPKQIEIRLHNQLYNRHILTERDARTRFNEVRAALQAALGVDAAAILAVYSGTGDKE